MTDTKQEEETVSQYDNSLHLFVKNNFVRIDETFSPEEHPTAVVIDGQWYVCEYSLKYLDDFLGAIQSLLTQQREEAYNLGLVDGGYVQLDAHGRLKTVEVQEAVAKERAEFVKELGYIAGHAKTIDALCVLLNNLKRRFSPTGDKEDVVAETEFGDKNISNTEEEAHEEAR